MLKSAAKTSGKETPPTVAFAFSRSLALIILRTGGLAYPLRNNTRFNRRHSALGSGIHSRKLGETEMGKEAFVHLKLHPRVTLPKPQLGN